MDMQERYYMQARHATENAKQYCRSGEFLRQQGYFAHSFIMASYAMEELGKSIQALGYSAQSGKNPSKLRDHNVKFESLSYFVELMTIMSNDDYVHKMTEELTISLGTKLSNLDETDDVISLNDVLQLLFDSISELRDSMPKYQNPLLEKNMFKSWLDYRFELLYVSESNPISPVEKWESVQRDFEGGQQVIDGTIFKTLDNLASMAHKLSEAPYAVFKESSKLMLKYVYGSQ